MLLLIVIKPSRFFGNIRVRFSVNILDAALNTSSLSALDSGIHKMLRATFARSGNRAWFIFHHIKISKSLNFGGTVNASYTNFSISDLVWTIV